MDSSSKNYNLYGLLNKLDKLHLEPLDKKLEYLDDIIQSFYKSVNMMKSWLKNKETRMYDVFLNSSSQDMIQKYIDCIKYLEKFLSNVFIDKELEGYTLKGININALKEYCDNKDDNKDFNKFIFQDSKLYFELLQDTNLLPANSKNNLSLSDKDEDNLLKIINCFISDRRQFFDAHNNILTALISTNDALKEINEQYLKDEASTTTLNKFTSLDYHIESFKQGFLFPLNRIQDYIDLLAYFKEFKTIVLHNKLPEPLPYQNRGGNNSASNYNYQSQAQARNSHPYNYNHLS